MAKKEHTKQKEVDVLPEPEKLASNSGVVVGDTKSQFAKKIDALLLHKRLLAIGVLVLIIIIASGTMAYLMVTRAKNATKQTTAEQAKANAEKAKIANSSYTDLSADEIAKKIKTETGLTKEQLSNQKIDTSTYKNFDSAYRAAKAYYGIGDYKKAIQVYAIADTYTSASTSYIFYLDYADAADAVDNSNQAVTMIKKAIEVINKSALSNDEKSTLTEKLQQKIDLRALGN